LKLGLAAGEGTAAAHATSAVADLSAQLQGLALTISASGTSSSGGEAAGTAAGNGAAEAVPDGADVAHVQYLQYSVESGVAAGFQLASAAGPLCDEPLWGVAFQVEARLNLTPAIPSELLAGHGIGYLHLLLPGVQHAVSMGHQACQPGFKEPCCCHPPFPPCRRRQYCSSTAEAAAGRGCVWPLLRPGDQCCAAGAAAGCAGG
jgi:hypothetical protein